MLALAAFALAAAQLAPAAAIAGCYETDQMEVAAALDLQPDGRFRYALDYGAVSEPGEGDWTFDGTAVLLTSNPMPPGPNALELGNARFEEEPLMLEDGDLLLGRYDTVFRFRRAEP